MMNALQEAQAKLRWRARERASGEGGSLLPVGGAPLELLETKQFRFDKSAIVGDTRRPAIIQALDALFTESPNAAPPPAPFPSTRRGASTCPSPLMAIRSASSTKPAKAKSASCATATPKPFSRIPAPSAPGFSLNGS